MIAVLLIASQILHGTADWPQWGGTGRDFTPLAPALAADWDTAPPRRVWSRDLGNGNAALVVADGRVFGMAGDGDRERVVALDADTGETLWEHGYDVRYTAFSEAYGGPHATPLIDGDDRLITVAIDAKVHALDAATGDVLWRRDLVAEHGVDLPQSGFAASPIAWGDLVIVAGTGGPGPAAIALRRSDGATVWARHSFLGSHASPRIIEFGGREHLVVHSTNFLVGLDPATGDLLWRGRVRSDAIDNVSFSPVWDDATKQFFVTHAYDGNGVQAWRLSGDSRSGFDLERSWTNRRLKVQHGNGVLLGGALHAADGESFLVGVDVESGDTRYKRRGVPKSTLLAADGKLLVLDGEGTLRLLRPSEDDVEELGALDVLEGNAWTVPTLVGRTVYLRDRRRIVALELP